ncbi:uncharacterized protein LOC106458522 [Limulus polyphemus]|uniref:Uncharacterized protein LOC106458522 n=1 Tax=Limulus polyphemus TaxID=6850 RepID=A0ABM1B2J4_LIMPO|nr:uncharacterized protein LOC106458522 [Limulus polyphemus]
MLLRSVVYGFFLDSQEGTYKVTPRSFHQIYADSAKVGDRSSKSASLVDVVDCTSGLLADFPTFSKSIYIIVQLQNQNSAVLKLFKFTNEHRDISAKAENGSLQEFVEIYTCDVCDIDFKNLSSQKLCLCDGPYMIWCVENKLNVFSSEKQEQKQFILKNTPIEKILFVEPILTKDELFIVSFGRNSKFSYQDQEVMFLVLQWSSNEVSFLPGAYFFPEAYKSLVTATKVYFTSSVENSLGKKHFHKFEYNTTVACTIYKQFIVFVHGCIKYCCEIPFSDAWKITRCSLLNKECFLLQSAKSDACVVSKRNSAQVQVIQTWENVSELLIGDFLRKGAPQLLILRQLPSNGMEEIRNFLLIETTSFTPLTVTEENSQDLSSNIDTALAGFQKRLIEGKALLSQAQDRLLQKREVIEDILHKLQRTLVEDVQSTDMVKNDVYPKLVTLVGPETSHLSTNFPVQGKEIDLEVVSHWQTVIQNKWIIGWMLKNVTGRSVRFHEISINMEQGETEFNCTVFNHMSEGMSSQPSILDKYKDEVLHLKDMVSLVVVSPLPLFTSASLEVCATISWTCDSSQKIHQLPVSSTVHAGDIWEMSEDALNNDGKLSIIQRMMSLRALQERLALKIQTYHSDLSFLEKILVSCFQHHPPVMLHHLNTRLFVFQEKFSPLYGINFTTRLLDTKHAVLELFYNDNSHLALFIHWLYNALPEDVLIEQTGEETLHQQLKSLCINAIREETGIIKSALVVPSSSVFDPPTELAANVSELECSESAQIDENKLVINSQEYRQFRLNLLEKEINADEIIAHLKSCYV